MSDDFLNEHRERPSPEFTEALWERLQAPRRPWWTRRLVWAPALLLLVLVGALAASPELRAGALAVVRAVGGIEVQETDIVPPLEGPVARSAFVTYDLEGAQRALPFAVRVPTWAPEGYVLVPEVSVLAAHDRRPVTTAVLTWRRGRLWIELWVEERPEAQPPLRLVAGHGSAEEVVVGGAPAALVRGAWSAEDGTYDASRSVALVWVEAELVYILRTWDSGISAEELIRMAESAH
jgi:hypothetical protein